MSEAVDPAARGTDDLPAGSQSTGGQVPATICLLDHFTDRPPDGWSPEQEMARPVLTIALRRLAGDGGAIGVDDRSSTPMWLVVCDGVLVQTLVTGDHASCVVHGLGDVVCLRGAATRITTAGQATVGVVDAEVMQAAYRLPALSAALRERGDQQLEQAYRMHGIAQLHRVENRLLAFFWHIAQRWGEVSCDHVSVKCPLGPGTLARLLGLRHPTVKLGLKALADEHLLWRDLDGAWRLDPSSEAGLAV